MTAQIVAPYLGIFCALMIGHALGDFSLQSDFIGQHKTPPGPWKHNLIDGHSVWGWALGAHCIIHAGFVWAISGSPALGAAEFVAHWVIDFVRCRRLISFHTDQALHVGCKVLWVAALAWSA